ncbi:MAG: carbohydrate ABC transporter permease [Chloroflexota bacterium]
MNATWNEKWDFGGAMIVALLACTVVMIAFLFMHWVGSSLTENGARLFSDFLYGAVGAIPVPYISIIPFVLVAATFLALWGFMNPDQARVASPLVAACGLVGLIYFYFAFFGPEPMWSQRKLTPGLGFWLAFAGLLVTVLAPLLAHPAVTGALARRSGAGGRGLPVGVAPYVFMAPALALYLLWIVGPTFYTIYLSLTNWDGVSAPGWVGLANYVRLFTKDTLFWESLRNNAVWLLVFISIPTTLGLGMAMVFNQEMKGGKLYKVSFYAPLVLSLPVIGLIWSWVYNPRLGLINNFLTGIGVADPPGWLGDRSLAIWCVIAAAVWRQVGYVMVLYLAGLKNIDPTLVDAARVDGADRWNLFRHVIFPLLAPVTTIIVVISIIDSLRSFDLVSIMTRGGQSTQVLANFMYIEAFNNYRMGYGAAIAVILFAISLVFIGFYLSQVIKDELEY